MQFESIEDYNETSFSEDFKRGFQPAAHRGRE